MNTQSNVWPQFLGEITTRIRMTEMDKNIDPNTEIFLDNDIRSADRHWRMAIIDNQKHRVTWLPKRLSSWVFPLLDQKKISIQLSFTKNTLPNEQLKYHSYRIVLKVFLEEQGASILEAKQSIQSSIDAMHEVIRDTYMRITEQSDPETIHEIGERLRHSIGSQSLPETKLLLSLFSWKAGQQRKRIDSNVLDPIRSRIKQIHIGEAQHYKEYSIFPLFPHKDKSADYTILKHALDSKTALVEEVSESGQVHELLLHNYGNKPILVPEGEILEGAKQNRVINISIMVGPKSTVKIPVSCVERGRWSRASKNFESTYYAHPKLRSKKMKSVFSSRKMSGEARSDQNEVWDEVACHIDNLSFESATESVTEAYEVQKKQIDEYQKHFKIPNHSIGLVIVSGDEIIGMDVFDSSEVFQHYWNRLAQAYFSEFKKKNNNRISSKTVHKFMKDNSNAIELCKKPIGIGHEFMLENELSNGFGVWYCDSLCHMSIFFN